MNLLKFLSSVLVLAFCFQSCTIESEGIKASSGRTGEILCIVDRQHWNDIVGDSIRRTFGGEFFGLPQQEPMFNLAHIEERAFTKMFESHRNIFIADIKPEHQPDIEVRKNVWAQPQVVVKIKAPDINSFLEKFGHYHSQIAGFYLENERERMKRAFKRDEDESIGRRIREHFGFSLVVPKGYFIAKMKDDFFWVRRETEETSIGFLIYTIPYTDTLVFEPDRIIELRDIMTKLYVPGPREGSYMQVSQKVVLPQFQEIDFKGHYAIETRGLWDLHGDFMGGPFINYTFVDEANQRVITLDGFVYAPRYDKRDYVFQTEALIFSFEYE